LGRVEEGVWNCVVRKHPGSDPDRSHNFAAAFVRNLRCSTVKSTDVGAC